MRDVVLYILLTSSALLHIASLKIGTPNSGFALSLVLSHERLLLRVVPRSSAKPLFQTGRHTWLGWEMAFVFPSLSSADATKNNFKVEYVAYLVSSEAQN